MGRTPETRPCESNQNGYGQHPEEIRIRLGFNGRGLGGLVLGTLSQLLQTLVNRTERGGTPGFKTKSPKLEIDFLNTIEYNLFKGIPHENCHPQAPRRGLPQIQDNR